MTFISEPMIFSLVSAFLLCLFACCCCFCCFILVGVCLATAASAAAAWGQPGRREIHRGMCHPCAKPARTVRQPSS